MSQETLRRRFAVAAIAVVALAAPLLSAGAASGDTIANKRAEASRVADQLEQLQQQAEVVAEQYNDARLELQSVDAKAKAAKAQSDRTQARLARSRKQVAGYAVDAYVRGGTASSASMILSTQSGDDIGQRQGYADVAVGNGADVIDQLRAAQAAAQADITNLKAARTKVVKVRDEVDSKRKEANASVAKQRAVLSKVTGELNTLVKAEQARRAAEAARQARALAAKLAAAQKRAEANRPKHTNTTQTHTTTVDLPTTTDPGNGGGDGGGSGGGGGGGGGTINPPVGVGADAAIAAARSVLGVRYTWGGASPSTGFDCSGLVMWAWQHGGKSLPHSSAAMYSSSTHIPMSELQPGDLVFYGSPVHHVALYIGGGQIIHAPHTGSYVQVASVYYWSDVRGAGRV